MPYEHGLDPDQALIDERREQQRASAPPTTPADRDAAERQNQLDPDWPYRSIPFPVDIFLES